jgi:hypothetical protein
MTAREAVRAGELAGQGAPVRLWQLPAATGKPGALVCRGPPINCGCTPFWTHCRCRAGRLCRRRPWRCIRATCRDLQELTTDTTKEAVSDDQMVSPFGQEAAGCRRRCGKSLAPVHPRSSPARPDQASRPSRGSSARPVRWVRRQPGLHHPLRRPLRRMTPRPPAEAAQPTRSSSPVHRQRAGDRKTFIPDATHGRDR